MNISTDFEIGDKVTITPTNMEGRVTAVHVTNEGLELRVKYYTKDSVNYDYFYPDELKKTEERKTGFVK